MNARDERRIAAATPLYLNLVGGKRVPAADDRTIDVVCHRTALSSPRSPAPAPPMSTPR
jgi:hypothetical protein